MSKLETFAPIRVPTAVEEVCGALLEPLRSGLIEVGENLPAERELAAQLGVSVHTVSEALAVLSSAGIVRQRRGRSGGTSVVSLENVPRVLDSLHGADVELGVRALLELRRPLELQAALLSAERAAEEQLAKLGEIASALDPALSHGEFRATDTQFHLYLGEACGNPRLRHHMRQYFDEYEIARERFPCRMTRDQAVRLQQSYLDAILSREREAVIEAVDAHLGEVEELLLGTRLTFP